MTIREKVIIMAYTQVSMFPKNSGMFHYYREYVEEILGRPIVTEDMALCVDEIIEKSKPDFIKLCLQSDNVPIGYITVQDAASKLGVETVTIRNWIRRGKIDDAVKIGREWYISEKQQYPARKRTKNTNIENL